MKCPKCNGPIVNLDTVHVSCNETFRKKKCKECGHVFYTVEFEVVANDRFKEEWKEYYRSNKGEQ